MRIRWPTVTIAAAISIIVVALALSRAFPSSVASIRVRNATARVVEFSYRISFFDRGSVPLAPNEQTKVAVYGGDSRPDKIGSIACEANWDGTRLTRTFELKELILPASDGRFPCVVVCENSVELEFLAAAPSSQPQREATPGP